ncbi:Aldehyde dehydrogenase [Fusarium oxysporum f. sp. raphani]|uniref:aldehyde dehydrogenase (NAD(+)) n=1 Tax=Fusarium oxysporum f. sp. raphani TaxID=96318 RepID=A0A8J5PP10_FUSOX|nr:Aldehyde dehydrogenase [Fusarium oxysporum f. sp. raphani]
MSQQLLRELTAPNGLKYTQPLGLFINNEWVLSSSGETIETLSPADESIIAAVQAATTEDVDRAVQAAREAFDGPWSDVAPTARAKLLHKFADLVEEHAEVLATIESWDNGKPYQTALTEDVAEVYNAARYHAGWADKLHGQVIPTESGQLAYTIREPVGVCGSIVPWNFPLLLAAWKLCPAIAAGNTSIIKAAEQTPLSILYLANLFKEAGFPPGVVNVINGYGKTAGAAMAGHLDIDKISFTGSTATGRQIMRLAAANLKDICLETGGKSPILIFEDANLQEAAKWAHFGIMLNAGQACSATSRILVHENIHEEFVRLLKEQTRKVSKIGDPFASETFQGPQVSKAQHNQILSYIELGKSEGAQLAYGGKIFDVGNGKGYYIEPTVFTHVTDDMRISREEVFGPFVVVSTFKTEQEAVRRANDTTYGLAAAIFSQDPARGHRLARRIRAGSVWINGSNVGDLKVPFGGFKQSGIGREGGEAGIAQFTNIKSVYLQMEQN